MPRRFPSQQKVAIAATRSRDADPSGARFPRWRSHTAVASQPLLRSAAACIAPLAARTAQGQFPARAKVEQVATYMLVLADSAGALWVIREQRMGFSDKNPSAGRRLNPGDRVFIYTTVNCWPRTAGQRRGRVIGEAVVATTAEAMWPPMHLAGRTVTTGCHLFFESLTPLGKGVELAPLVSDLESLKHYKSYGPALRRGPVALTPADAALLRERLYTLPSIYEESIESYAAEGRTARAAY